MHNLKVTKNFYASDSWPAQEIYFNMDFVSTEILKTSVLVFSKFYKTITLINSSISNCQYVLLKRLGQQHFNLFPGTHVCCLPLTSATRCA